MKKAINIDPILVNQMYHVDHLQMAKKTKSYPVIYHSRKRYAESEEEE
ncbi:MAG: hypothetical protein R6W85_07760 [Gillisia sp.]